MQVTHTEAEGGSLGEEEGDHQEEKPGRTVGCIKQNKAY